MKRILFTAITAAIMSSAFAAGQCQLTDLRSEMLVNPIGMDVAKPRLSWKMQDDRRGAIQKAYQLQVATTTETLLSGKPDVWDSGRQETSASANIVYGGPALKPTTRYVWHVKAWDKDGQECAYSDPAIWETGLMDRANWKAKWIGTDYKQPEPDTDFDKVTWIWYPEGDPQKKTPKGNKYFRYHFELPKKNPVKTATAWVLADNSCIVYINGKRAQTVSGFGGVAKVDVAKYFKGGVNVIQIAASNKSDSPAAVAYCADLTFKDGTTKRITSDISWRTSKESGKDWPEDGSGEAKWIGAKDVGTIGVEPWGTPNVDVVGAPASLHRKDFDVKAKPASARLYITALGAYKAQINGETVSDDILSPGWTDYRDRVLYQAYDVTPLLKAGKNAIGVTLGDGWYASALGWKLDRFNFGVPPTRFLAQLELSYPDGSKQLVTSDETWKTTGSAIRRSEIYAGERYDARLEQAGWSSAGFDDSEWVASLTPETTASIVINWENVQPIRVEQELVPVSITEITTGTYIVDMGQNMVGWARLKVKGKAGDTVRMRFVEILNPDGTAYTENLRRAEATDTYTLKGGDEEIFEPHFTYHGFRYIEVTGYPGGAPTKDAIIGRVFRSDMPIVGKFESSDPMVNRIVQNTMWGLKGNLMSVPTDCPQRDERLGWTGDAQAIWKTACYNLDMAAFTEKWIRDVRDAQGPKGDYPNVAPRIISNEPGAPAWGDAGIIVPYDAWRMYGDTQLVAEHWDSMEEWMQYILAENGDYIWMKRRGNDYGDWVPANSETDKTLIATAYWAGDALKMKEMAAALGKGDKVREYDELYGKIKKAFQEKFVQADGKIANGSQTCYILALDNGLVQDDMVERAVGHLTDDITSRGQHLSTGFLGSTYLMPVLTRHGRNDVAVTLLLNKTFPSWGYMIEKGATTIWERWNSDTGDPAMNSFNHYCYGAVTDWLYGYFGGIRPVTPGFEEVIIEPYPDKRVNTVKVSYDGNQGTISSEWKYDGDALAVNVVIPANSIATVALPATDAAKVTEGGKDLKGAGLEAGVAANGRVAVKLGAGKYNFLINP